MHEGRFGRLWAEWDRRVDAGERPEDILDEAKDEDLVEVLAGESDVDRRYTRDIIATELLNRLHERTKHPAKAKAVAASAKTAHAVARESQGPIHRAEEILKASGEWDLGASVSASAYASLDATREAFDAAKDQAEDLQANLSTSRGGSELAEEAAQTAEEGREITREIEGKMDEIGRGKEGREASAAAKRIQKEARRAADVAVPEASGIDAKDASAARDRP